MISTVIVGILLVSTTLGAEQCYDELKWTTDKGKILVNGQPLVLKGITYYGFESDIFMPHGIWDHNLDRILDTVKNNGFNAIRVPFSMAMIGKNPRVTKVHCYENVGLCNKRALPLLDTFIDRAADRGLLVMLANQRNAAGGDIGPKFWYDDEYPEKRVLDLWAQLASRYDNQWNVFALDLKNQPRDGPTWGDKNESTDWKMAAEKMIVRMRNFNGLFFISGLEWGARFEMAKYFPIDTEDNTLNKRVVYGPTCNGPKVYMRDEFTKPDFPNNLDKVYQGKFGFLVNKTGRPVVLADWAAKDDDEHTKDDQWNNWLVDWLRQKCLTNNFYWCLNPESHHTDGGFLMADWRTPVPYRASLLQRLQPNPTKFKFDGTKKQICITPGVFPEPHCRG